MGLIDQGLKTGSAIIGGQAIKFNRGERLVCEDRKLAIVEAAGAPVKGWVNYRLLINDARRRKVSYQIAFSEKKERMAENKPWRKLCEEDAEIAQWVEGKIRHEFKKKYEN